MQSLKTYDISENRGFLCKFEADQVDQPAELAEIRSIALSLPFHPLTDERRKGQRLPFSE